MSQTNTDDAQALAAVNMQSARCDPNPVIDKTTPPHPGEKDIESLLTNVTSLNSISGKDLSSNSRIVLKAVQNEIGARQVTVSSLEFAPDWLIDDTIKSELDTNWSSAYTPIPVKAMPKNANIIGSRFVFKIKEDETYQLN